MLAIVLLCLVVCRPAATAQAAQSTPGCPDPNEPCSLSLTLTTGDGTAAAGLTLGVLRVAPLTIDADGTCRYQLSEEYASTGVSLDGLGDASSDAATASQLVSYAQARRLPLMRATTDAEGRVGFSGLSCGLYAVTLLGGPKGYELASPFLVTLPQENGDGWTYDVDATPKPVMTHAEARQTPPARPAKRLPQTGQLWWPVLFLAFAGCALFAAGWHRGRRANCR